MARRGQRQSGSRRSAPQSGRRGRNPDNEGIIPVLARAVREVETAVEKRSAMPSVSTKFQVVALLVREERARVKADAELSEGRRAEQLKRLDGVATILAKTAARDSRLLTLLAEDAVVSSEAKALKRELMESGGLDAPEELPEPVADDEVPAVVERRVVPQSVISRQLANPFLAPDAALAERDRPRARRLAGWELLGPLFRSFEYGDGAASAMALPEPVSRQAPGGLELMRHQAQLVASATNGHRTFLLADEPGLGKTAQALLAAQATKAYPLLVVVPNVVKTN
ncbi:MAG: ATP-dependent helicase, partial [Nocardioides sp.]